MSGAGVGSYAAQASDVSTGADAAKAKAELAIVEVAAVTYTMVEAGQRLASARCYNCGSQCELHQSKDADGEWTPALDGRLDLFGWKSADGRWYCGKFCAMRVEQQIRAGHKVLPVEKVNDASYQARRIYAEPAAVTAAVPIKRR